MGRGKGRAMSDLKKAAEEALRGLLAEGRDTGVFLSKQERQFLLGSIWVLREVGVLTTEEKWKWYREVDPLSSPNDLQGVQEGRQRRGKVKRVQVPIRTSRMAKDGSRACPECGRTPTKRRPAAFTPAHVECPAVCCGHKWIPAEGFGEGEA